MSTPDITTAITLGATFSAAFSSLSLALSHMVIPALNLLPTSPADTPVLHAHAARAWQFVYNTGKRAGPVIGTLGAVSYTYAARYLPDTAATEQRQLLYAAALMNMLVGPFTIAVMSSTNNEIWRRAEGGTVKAAKEGGTWLEKMETPELLKRWGMLNALRSVFPIVAIGFAVRGLWL